MEDGTVITRVMEELKPTFIILYIVGLHHFVSFLFGLIQYMISEETCAWRRETDTWFVSTSHTMCYENFLQWIRRNYDLFSLIVTGLSTIWLVLFFTFRFIYNTHVNVSESCEQTQKCRAFSTLLMIYLWWRLGWYPISKLVENILEHSGTMNILEHSVLGGLLSNVGKTETDNWKFLKELDFAAIGSSGFNAVTWSVGKILLAPEDLVMFRKMNNKAAKGLYENIRHLRQEEVSKTEYDLKYVGVATILLPMTGFSIYFLLTKGSYLTTKHQHAIRGLKNNSTIYHYVVTKIQLFLNFTLSILRALLRLLLRIIMVVGPNTEQILRIIETSIRFLNKKLESLNDVIFIQTKNLAKAPKHSSATLQHARSVQFVRDGFPVSMRSRTPSLSSISDTSPLDTKPMQQAYPSDENTTQQTGLSTNMKRCNQRKWMLNQAVTLLDYCKTVVSEEHTSSALPPSGEHSLIENTGVDKVILDKSRQKGALVVQLAGHADGISKPVSEASHRRKINTSKISKDISIGSKTRKCAKRANHIGSEPFDTAADNTDRTKIVNQEVTQILSSQHRSEHCAGTVSDIHHWKNVTDSHGSQFLSRNGQSATKNRRSSPGKQRSKDCAQLKCSAPDTKMELYSALNNAVETNSQIMFIEGCKTCESYIHGKSRACPEHKNMSPKHTIIMSRRYKKVKPQSRNIRQQVDAQCPQVTST